MQNPWTRILIGGTLLAVSFLCLIQAVANLEFRSSPSGLSRVAYIAIPGGENPLDTVPLLILLGVLLLIAGSAFAAKRNQGNTRGINANIQNEIKRRFKN